MSWSAGGSSSKTPWRGPSQAAASTPHAALRLGNLARDQLKSRHLRADSLRDMFRDCANATGPSGVVSNKRRRVCIALCAAFPHCAAQLRSTPVRVNTLVVFTPPHVPWVRSQERSSRR